MPGDHLGLPVPLVPGIYNIPPAAYHLDPCPDPSLSSSIAKVICLQSPAHAFHEHPRLNTAAAVEDDDTKFDIGTAAHALLLEGDAGVAIIDANDWRTKDAKVAREAARSKGLVPLLTKQWAHVQAMVEAARQQLQVHRDGRGMFAQGEAERTLIWLDERGVWCRARLDYLRGPYLYIDDYKTTGASADPDAWTKTLFATGFDIQAAWYRRGVKTLTGVDATFRFAVQETFPPYALSVIALAPSTETLAEKKVIYALDAWGAGLESREWVGYPRQTCFVELPPWHESWWLEKECR